MPDKTQAEHAISFNNIKTAVLSEKQELFYGRTA